MKALRESCGVVGAVKKSGDVVENIWLSLLALQHRGQEAAGIYTHDGDKFYHEKKLGLVPGLENFANLRGSIGIGHTRYSTVGKSASEDIRNGAFSIDGFAQPFFVDYQKNGIALCHNGNLVNKIALGKKLLSSGIFLSSESDSEIILKTLVKALMATKDLETAVSECMSQMEGSYSITAVTGEGEVFAFRDPYGFRPLCYGQNENLTMMASESVALNVNGITSISDVKPGQLVLSSSDHDTWRKHLCPCTRKAYCMFEYVYFSRPDSTLNGKDVYSVRINLGRNLARTYSTDADVIVPVPDTARPAAEGISRETGIYVAEGLIKNRYIGRTFIMPEQKTRSNSVAVKLNPVRSVLKDKKVVLVDDSIVRGTTSEKIVSLVKNAGAKKVELWITCPPITSPCFYGIDIATHKELVAFERSIPEIEKLVKADNLRYQTLEGLLHAIGYGDQELCLGCLTGEYPTPLAQELSDQMKGKKSNERIRYWEMK
jgi:amidophosphoribosyltransferase